MRPPSRPSTIWLSTFALLAAAAASGCEAGPDLSPAGEAAAEVGEVGLAIEIGPGVFIHQLDYQVLRAGILIASGTSAAEARPVIRLTGLLAGGGYEVRLTGTTSAGVPCSGSAVFTVPAQGSVMVNVALACGVSNGGGEVAITPSFNSCSRIRTAAATELPGSPMRFALVVNTMFASAAYFYQWSASAGRLENEHRAQATFVCESFAGQVNIAVAVRDGTCQDTASLTVDCTLPGAGLCGDGTRSGTEQCESSGLPTPACDETCTSQPPGCHACMSNTCPADFAGCSRLTGLDRSSCQAVIGCAVATRCLEEQADLMPCYCGTADIGACLGGSGNGACKAEIESAARTTNPQLIGERFTDPSHPLGMAVNYFGCRGTYCAAECPNRR